MLFTNDVLGRTHWNDPLSAAHLAIALAALPMADEVDVVCVGTDRSTGDALGALNWFQFVGPAGRRADSGESEDSRHNS